MRSLRLILALGMMVAGLAAPAFASSTTKQKTYPHKTSQTHHTATKHAAPHAPAKKSTHSTYKKPAHKTYKHYAKPKPRPKPKPGIQADGRYVLPGGLESTCAGGTPPPCR
jgi:hypothetical protein